MCTTSAPKPDQSAVDAAKKQPQYLRNPWLDGLSIQGAGENTGRNSLVINPGTKAPAPGTTPIFTTPNTNLGIGSGGGFGRPTGNLFGGLITIDGNGVPGGPLGSRLHRT